MTVPRVLGGGGGGRGRLTSDTEWGADLGVDYTKMIPFYILEHRKGLNYKHDLASMFANDLSVFPLLQCFSILV